jgi:hypothetical protein
MQQLQRLVDGVLDLRAMLAEAVNLLKSSAPRASSPATR